MAAYLLGEMGSQLSFEKVGKCFYRNSSSGTYYALIKKRGKQIKRSLQTDNLPEARRKLRGLCTDMEHIDPSATRLTLAGLVAKRRVDKYLPTIAHQARNTIVGKEGVCRWVLAKWPGGATRDVAKIKPSEAAEFLAGYSSFGIGAMSAGVSSQCPRECSDFFSLSEAVAVGRSRKNRLVLDRFCPTG